MPRGGAREGSGRKKGAFSSEKQSIIDMAREHAKDALAVLSNALKDTTIPYKERIVAANSILDRAYGKPVQAIAQTDGEGNDVSPAKILTLTDEQLLSLAARGSAGGDGVVAP